MAGVNLSAVQIDWDDPFAVATIKVDQPRFVRDSYPLGLLAGTPFFFHDIVVLDALGIAERPGEALGLTLDFPLNLRRAIGQAGGEGGRDVFDVALLLDFSKPNERPRESNQPATPEHEQQVPEIDADRLNCELLGRLWRERLGQGQFRDGLDSEHRGKIPLGETVSHRVVSGDVRGHVAVNPLHPVELPLGQALGQVLVEDFPVIPVARPSDVRLAKQALEFLLRPVELPKGSRVGGTEIEPHHLQPKQDQSAALNHRDDGQEHKQPVHADHPAGKHDAAGERQQSKRE